ncbi:MAG: ABC transporter permease [Acidimicrobiia bacterium]
MEMISGLLNRVRRAPLSLVIGSVLVFGFVAVGLLSLVWTPHDPEGVNVAQRLLPPGTPDYPMGTDRLGRDVLTQVMAGARNSLLVSVVSTIVAVVPGVLLGLAAAGSGRIASEWLSRITDIGVALPGILVALVLATVLGPGNQAAIIAIIVWFVPVVARVTIGPARQVLSREFVEAAFSYGRSRRYVMLRHVLPNIAPLILVQASVMFAAAILIEAALSYLGAGAQRPTPSWGRLLNEAQPLIDIAPTLMIFPGVSIMIAVLGFNLMGDGLRTILDPQQASHPTQAASEGDEVVV